jgi:hypothetical protein
MVLFPCLPNSGCILADCGLVCGESTYGLCQTGDAAPFGYGPSAFSRLNVDAPESGLLNVEAVGGGICRSPHDCSTMTPSSS